MASIKAHHHVLILLFLALGLTCLIAPWLALGADGVAARWPRVLDERVPFGRVFNRAFMIAVIALFLVMRRRLMPAGTIQELLAISASKARRHFLAGFVLALGSMALLLAVMTAAGVYAPFFRLSLERSLQRLASAMASGLAAGFLEEFFFRGTLFLAVLRSGGRWKAYLLVNLFYSAVHFVKPGEDYFLDRPEPLAGFRHLLTTFTPFVDLPALLPGIVGLFLLGAALSYALERTGNLYLPFGLHAGWIVAIKSVRIVGDYTRPHDLGWVFGSSDPKIVSGIATWLGIALLTLVVMRLTRPGGPLAADPIRRAGA